MWQVVVSTVFSQTILGLALLSGLVAYSFANAQQTIRVPGDAPTIQSAIDVAHDGDTVFVSPGTYNESLDFKGKNITVTSGAKSYSEAASTILNSTSDGPAVFFHQGETRSAVLNGFTIQNGHPGPSNSHGSGVAIDSSSPTVSNNVITRNIGCGLIVADGGAPLIQGNDVNGNLPLMANGDTSCQLGNGGGSSGSGVALYLSGNVDLLDNLIENNNTWDTQANVGIAGILIDGNVVNAGAVTIRLEGNVIRNNHGSGPCTALCVGFTPNIIMINNLFYGNERSNGTNGVQINIGGGNLQPLPMLVEVNNTVYGAGEEVVQRFAATSVIANNAFYDNLPNDFAYALRCGSFNHGIDIHNNDIFNTGHPFQLFCGSSDRNIAVDPMFVDPANGDFHTKDGSPLMAAGDITAPLIPATDLDKKARTVCNTIDIGAYEHRPHPPILLTSSANTVAGGSPVTFTAKLTGNCNVPTGVVTFADNGTVIGTGTLDGSATATYSTSFLTVGSHHIVATYPGDFNFDDSTSNTVELTVTGLPSTTNLRIDPNPAKAFQPITLTANVTNPYVQVTGTVTFVAGTTPLGRAPLVNGIAAITTSQLGAGTYAVTAAFNATTQFGASSASATLEVNGDATSTALRSSSNPSFFGQAVVFRATVSMSGSSAIPQGTVTFRDGATTLGTGTLDATGGTSFSTAQLTVGSHRVTAQYGGSTNANTSTSSVVVQVVNPAATAVTLTGTPNPASVGQVVTLTASVAGASASAPPSGMVSFTDQDGVIGTASLDAGRVVFSTSTLAAGTHAITATFLASGSFAGATSAPLTEVIQTFDFTITLSNPTVTVVSGASTTVTAQIQGVGNVTGNVALSAANVPQPAAVAFNPTAVTFPGGASGNAIISITTALQPHASLSPRPNRERVSARIFAALLLAPLFLVRRKRIRAMFVLLLGLLSLACISGCTNISYPVSRLSPGTYTIPITGVDQTSKISHTVNLTLNVTQ